MKSSIRSFSNIYSLKILTEINPSTSKQFMIMKHDIKRRIFQPLFIGEDEHEKFCEFDLTYNFRRCKQANEAFSMNFFTRYILKGFR